MNRNATRADLRRLADAAAKVPPETATLSRQRAGASPAMIPAVKDGFARLPDGERVHVRKGVSHWAASLLVQCSDSTLELFGVTGGSRPRTRSSGSASSVPLYCGKPKRPSYLLEPTTTPFVPLA